MILPISWGICEVPGWGTQLPIDHVLREMAELGFTHTEMGAIGWLPTDVDSLSTRLRQHELSLLGGFVPLALHNAAHADQARSYAHEMAALLSGSGAQFFVTAAVSAPAEFRHIDLDDHQWAHLCEMVAEMDELVAGYGLRQVVHPHVDTVLERSHEVERFLAGTDADICLDTAHLAVGGSDLVSLARNHGHRVGLVHLKDLDLGVAEDLSAGRISLMQAVQQRVFPPLGRGELPIAEIVTFLEASGRDLWYVLEQDTALTDGTPPVGAGPKIDVSTSIEFLRPLDSASAGSTGDVDTTTQEG